MDIIAARVAYIFSEDDFDVDRIVGPENIGERDMERLASIVMRDFDPEFRFMVRPGDMLIGGRNFRYGHPHYPPMQGMRHLGIARVIAESFAPGYWREEMEEGFPQVTCAGILNAVSRWDNILVSFKEGVFRNTDRDIVLSIDCFSFRKARMLKAGALNALLKINNK